MIDRLSKYNRSTTRLGDSRRNTEISSPHDVEIHATAATVPVSGTPAELTRAAVRNTPVINQTNHRPRTPERRDSSHTVATWPRVASSRRMSRNHWASAAVRTVTSAIRHALRAESSAQKTAKTTSTVSRRDLPPQDEVVHRRESEEPDERGIDGDVGAQGHTSRHRWLPEDYRKFKPGTELLRGPR